MLRDLSQWFDSKPFAQQILVLALIFDPIGFGAGYLLAPTLDVEPLIGGVYGLVAASMPLSLHIMRESSDQ